MEKREGILKETPEYEDYDVNVVIKKKLKK